MLAGWKSIIVTYKASWSPGAGFLLYRNCPLSLSPLLSLLISTKVTQGEGLILTHSLKMELKSWELKGLLSAMAEVWDKWSCIHSLLSFFPPICSIMDPRPKDDITSIQGAPPSLLINQKACLVYNSKPSHGDSEDLWTQPSSMNHYVSEQRKHSIRYSAEQWWRMKYSV